MSFGTCTLTAMTVLLSGVIDWTCRGERATSTAAVALRVQLGDAGLWRLRRRVLRLPLRLRTLIGWAFYGEQFLAYWLGQRVVMPYRWIYCLLIPFGAISR